MEQLKPKKKTVNKTSKLRKPSSTTVYEVSSEEEDEAPGLHTNHSETVAAAPQPPEENGGSFEEDLLLSLPTAPMIDFEHTEEAEFDQMTVLLPVQEDDWELTTTDKNQEQIYPTIDKNDDAGESVLKPFTAEERSSFYENILLKHDETYTDQFLADAHMYNDHFKSLLLNYRQARLRLHKARKTFESQNEVISKVFGDVFKTGEGEVIAEAYCQDQRKVKYVHRYETCSLNHDALDQLSSALASGRQIASEDVMLCSYTSTVSRLRCEQYLYELREKYTIHRDRLKKSTVSLQTGDVSILLQLMGETIAELKSASNFLFTFVRQRRNSDEADDQFWKDVERWLSLVLLLLLQAAEDESTPGRHFSEEMFVVNHLIRCPPGIYKWISGLAQVSGPLGFGLQDKTSLDHSLYLLHLILSFPKGRNEFLDQFIMDEHHTPTQPNSGWTMIDEDGEEMDSLQGGGNIGILALESDLISLFCQVPINSIVGSVLGLTYSSDEVYYYEDLDTTSRDLMNTFIVLDVLCEILGEGLQALGRPKYKQLVRRIAQTLRNVVLLVSEHWQFYQQQDGIANEEMYGLDRLQLEFDELCKRSISRLLSVARLGVYQFIADLPFHAVSARAAETLYVLMNVPETSRDEVGKLVGTAYAHEEWVEFIQDPDTKLAFEEQLSSMPTNEVVYLLTAFANLAQSRQSDEEHLVNNVSVDIFQISFVYKCTMDVCSKTGRELLSSLATRHPFVISTVLQFVYKNFDSVTGVMYAFNDLPFHLWQPVAEDMTILNSYLKDYSVTSIHFRLAKVIIQALNFQYNESGELFLSHSIHCQLALIICEVNVKLEYERQRSGVMLKSFDHVSRIASVTRVSSQSAYEQFAAWSWQILLQLKLHQRQLSLPTPAAGVHKWKDGSSNVYDLHTDVLLVPLLQAVQDKHCMASYVALLMTQFGHSVDAFLNEGLELFYHLASCSNGEAVVKCLHCLVCVFHVANINLTENQRFQETLVLLLRSSNPGIISGIAGKLLSAESSENPVESMILAIHSHISEGVNDQEKTLVMSYWLRMLLSLRDWYKIVNSHAVLDYIFMRARAIGGNCLLECRTLLYGSYVDLMLTSHNQQSTQQRTSVVSSILHLVSGGNRQSVPCFISSFESVKSVYFAFAVLDAETRYEDDSKLWTTVLLFLQSDAKLSVDGALKKAANKLKLEYPPQAQHLALYRWGDLASETPPDHPLLQCIWIKFFLRFIFLPPNGGDSLGCRFFGPVSTLSTFNKFRARLQNASEHHRTIIANRSYEPQAKSHHERCVQTFQSFKLWLEEPKIHEINLYLPSLPPQYECEMLSNVRTQSQDICTEAINLTRIAEEVEKVSTLWRSSTTREETKQNKRADRSDMDADERLVKMTQLLKQFEIPKPLPSTTSIGPLSPPVAIGDVAQIWKYDTVLHMIDQDLKILSSFSEDFVKLQGLHWKIDSEYLTLLPNLYYMKDKEMTRNVECQSGFASTHRCSGAAKVRLRFKEKAERESKSKEMKANRKTCEKVLQRVLNEDTSGDLCFASLHLESVIRALELNAKSLQYSDDVHRSAKEAGTNLMYLLASMYSKERKSCQLTKHLICTCVETLGEVFVSQATDQAPRILDEVLANPDSASLLSPHFCPGTMHTSVAQQSQAQYVTMYRRVVEVVSSFAHRDSDVLFVLLTKFDLSEWMSGTLPSLHERSDLLFSIFNGITSEFKNRNQQMRKDPLENDKRKGRMSENVLHVPQSAIHEIYLGHLKTLLAFRFPELLHSALKRLLEGSHAGVVTVDVWKAFLTVSFPDTLESGDEQLAASEQDALHPLAYSSKMDWNCLMAAIECVSGYFRDHQLLEGNKPQSLYSHWMLYVESLSFLFARLGQTMVILARNGDIPEPRSQSGQQLVSPPWAPMEPIFSLYYAWLFPVNIPETNDVFWPWQDNEAAAAKFISESFAQVLLEFCQGDNLVVSPRLSYIWSQYAQVVILAHYSVPGAVFRTYHEIFEKLPWHLFLPDMHCLDQMVAICDGKHVVLMDFLCFLLPKISWPTVLELCGASSEDATNAEQGDVFYRLLYVLFALGADETSLQSYAGLEALFGEVASLPLHLIAVDHVAKLSGLVCDRYSWSSVLLRTSAKQLKNDRRYITIRLLKIVCKLPLVGGENTQVSPVTTTTGSSSSDYLKQEMFISCVGRLLQKSSVENSSVVFELTKRLSSFIATTMESVETTPRGGAVDHLPLLIGSVFTYLNIIPAAYHEDTLRAIINVVSRPSACKESLGASEQAAAHATSPCQNCVFLRSRALSQDTLLACISASAKIMTAQYTCQVLEAGIESYLNRRIVDQLTTEKDFSDRSTEATKGWNHVLSALNPVKNRENIYKECVDRSCLLTLHALMMNEVDLPRFYDRKDGLSADMLSDTAKVEIDIKMRQLISYLSNFQPTKESEAKVLLLIDHMICGCAILWETPIVTHYICDQVGKFLHMLDVFSMDKVKSGLLGSIGISRQSSLSPEFRLATRSISCFLKHWYARFNPESDDAVSTALDAFDAINKLPQSNKLYVPFSPVISEACDLISHDLGLGDYRKLTSLFVRRYYSCQMYVVHLLPTS